MWTAERDLVLNTSSKVNRVPHTELTGLSKDVEIWSQKFPVPGQFLGESPNVYTVGI